MRKLFHWAILVCFLPTSHKSCIEIEELLLASSATKTPYSHHNLLMTKTTLINKEDNCEASNIWLLTRHGTRYPSKAGLEGILNVLPRIVSEARKENRTELCESTIDAMEAWIPHHLTLDVEKKLHAEGEVEMISLAERLSRRFPRLLNASPDFYRFRATATQRTEQSQFFFASGLFNESVAFKINYEPPRLPHDPLLRFYKICAKWVKETKKNPNSQREKRLFEEKYFIHLSESVQRRLGLVKSVTMKEIDSMYNGCVFGQAWHPAQVSPWCHAFSKRDLEILEYREDLDHYWQDGYGFPINYEQACVLLKDLTNILSQKGVFYFTHSGTILKFISFLGLFKDEEHLRYDTFSSEVNKDRKWRTSVMDPFGANIAFVVQSCGETERKIGLFVNEVLSPIPGCDATPWCNFTRFFELFKESMEQCNFDQLCAVTGEEDEELLRDVPDDRF